MSTSSARPVAPPQAHEPGAFSWQRCDEDPVLRRIQPKGMPLLFGEEDLEMGESDLHTRTCGILLYGLDFHLAGQTALRPFSNLNLYYSPKDPAAYVSPDGMVVKPRRRLPRNVTSYVIGADGPAPLLVAEVLSFRTYHQGDLTHKPVLYAGLGIQEYLVIDVSGELLEEKLLCLERQANGRWKDQQDADGGVTSRLGFRLIVDADGELRVLDVTTKKAYGHPRDAQAGLDALHALRESEARNRQLEGELARLKKPRKRGNST